MIGRNCEGGCKQLLCAYRRPRHMRGMLLQDDPLKTRPPQKPFYKTYPPVLLGLMAAIIGVSIIQFLAGPEFEDFLLRSGAVLDLGQFPGVTQPFGPYASYVLHTFLHGGVLHLAMNMWALAVFGVAVARAMGPGLRSAVAFLAFFYVCAIGGAIAQTWLFAAQSDGGIMIGASSAISGLLPALGWLQGGWQRAVRLSLPWLLINVALIFVGGALPVNLAWAAHLGGLAAGFTFPLFFIWARH